MKHFLTSALGVIGAGIAAAFGGWGAAMTTLCIFMAVDYVTGLLVAGVFHASKKSESGRLDSRAGFTGLLRKGMILLIVLIAARLDILLNTTFVRDAVVIAFCANEAISIVENAGMMGVPIPAALRRAIEALEQNAENKKINAGLRRASEELNQKFGAAAENNKCNTSNPHADDDLTPEEADCRITIRNPELHKDGGEE